MRRLDEAGRNGFDTPVTPEAAGSSPVAPVKVPANRQLVLSVRTANLTRLHRLFRCETRNARKRRETGRPGIDFKPIQPLFRLSAKRACDYTKWPEVTAPPAVAVECGKGGLGRRQGADRGTAAPQEGCWNARLDNLFAIIVDTRPARKAPCLARASLRNTGPVERLVPGLSLGVELEDGAALGDHGRVGHRADVFLDPLGSAP